MTVFYETAPKAFDMIWSENVTVLKKQSAFHAFESKHEGK
jgi:hypothetical protein